MGEAPVELGVQEIVTEIVSADLEGSRDELAIGGFERPKHQRSLSGPAAMPSSSGSDSDVEGTQSNEETRNYSTITTSARRVGMDTTSESSSSDNEITVERQPSRVTFFKPAEAAAVNSLEENTSSAAGGDGTKPSPITTVTATLQKSSSGKSKVTHHRFPSRRKKKSGAKTTRFRNGEQESEDEELRKRKKKRYPTSWTRKSMHRAKRAKEYSTSESEEDEVLDNNQQVLVSDPMPQPTVQKSNSVSKSEESPRPRKQQEIAKNDKNSSSDSDASTTTTASDDSDDEDEDEKEEQRKPHSRKSSFNRSPPHVNPRGRAGEETSSITQLYRPHTEGRHLHQEHDNSDDDRDEQTDDDRHIRKQKGNSASFNAASGSRSFRWSDIRITTKIFYSFRGLDDEGSKVVSIRNLAPNVNKHLLQDFFRGCGTVTEVNIFRDQFGLCSGSAYIEFDSAIAARKAQHKTGSKFLGRVVHCEIVHELTTSRPVESKSETKNPNFHSKSKNGTPSAPAVSTGVGIDIHSILRVFTRGDNTTSEDSVQNGSHKKSRSTESLHLPTKRDTLTASSGNEESVHDPNTTAESFRGGQSAGATSHGSRKKLFGLSRSKSSSSKRKGSGKLGGSYSQSQHPPSQDPEPEGPQPQLESGEAAETASKRIEAREYDFHSRSIEVQSVPEAESRKILDKESELSKDPRKWSQRHPWMKKMMFWQHVKTPRWHSCHSANSVQIRVGHASIKKSPSLDLGAEPPEGYPLGYPYFSSDSKRR